MQKWEGNYRGKAKYTRKIGVSPPTVSTQDINITVSRESDGSLRFVTGDGKDMVLKPTPSNPNAAFGKGEKMKIKAGPHAEGEASYKITAFMRDGRLYVAWRQDGVAVAHFPGLPQTTGKFTDEWIAILDRVK